MKGFGSIHGHVPLERCYRYCAHCKTYSFPVEVTLGVSTGYSNGLKRIVTRCVGFSSYRYSKEPLAELCGIHLPYTTIGKIAGLTADEIAAQMDDNPTFKNVFQKAKGNSEFYMDGTFVPILKRARTWWVGD
jgi:hypothetical protein